MRFCEDTMNELLSKFRKTKKVEYVVETNAEMGVSFMLADLRLSLKNMLKKLDEIPSKANATLMVQTQENGQPYLLVNCDYREEETDEEVLERLKTENIELFAVLKKNPELAEVLLKGI
jgi:hypothetical protein